MTARHCTIRSYKPFYIAKVKTADLQENQHGAPVGAIYGVHLYEGCKKTFPSLLYKYKTLQMQYFLFKKSILSQDEIR